MFSRRLSWDEAPNALSRLVEKKRLAKDAFLDLTESNPTRAGFSYPEREILQSLSAEEALRYQPSPQGLLSAREAVAGYYAARGLAVEPERVWLTTSTSEAYGYLFKILCDPGDTVLVPQPSYPLFEMLAHLEGVRLRSYPLVYDGSWSIDAEALRERASGARAIVVVHPNNPTGSFLKQNDLALLRSLSLPVICDEVFGDYRFSQRPDLVSSLVEEKELPCFVLSGFSKILGLPQLKLGWIVTAGSPSFLKEAGHRLEWVLDTYLSVSAPIQHAAAPLLSLRGRLSGMILERVLSNRNFLRAQLDERSPCTLLRAEGGWYATLRVPAYRSEEEWALLLLEEEGVYVHPGYFFDFEREAFLVLSLLTKPEVFREGVSRLLARFAREIHGG